MSGKKNKDAAKTEATGEEPVMVWAITCKGVKDCEHVATEEEAEVERGALERDQREEQDNPKLRATKKMVRAATEEELAHYGQKGSFVVGEEAEDEPADESDNEEESDGAPEAFSEAEEKLAADVLAKLRASDKALTVAELHPETNEAGTDGYVAAGQIDKVLKKILVPHGVAELDGEAFVAVRPGVLAKRRGELLARLAEDALQDEEWADSLRAMHEAFTPTDWADARRLLAAGLLSPPEEDGEDLFTCPEEKAKEILRRGAIALVEEAMLECREGGEEVITDGDSGKVIANAERLLREMDAKLEQGKKDLGVARAALAAKTADVETLRGWFRTNNLPFPLDKPEAPKPPREEFTHTITPSAADKGRMYGIRLKLQARRAEVDATLTTAKATHKAHAEMLDGRIKSLDDAVTGMFYDAPAFRRVLIDRGVAQVVHVEDESWVLDEKELRSEQIAAEKAKAEEAAKPPAPVPEPKSAEELLPADGAMRIIPPGEEEGTTAEGTIPAAPPAPVVPVPERLPAPPKPPLTTESVRAEMKSFCDALPAGEMVSVTEFLGRVARQVFGVDPESSIANLAKVAVRSLHKAGTIHFELDGGREMIGKVRTKADTEADKAAASGEKNAADKMLDEIRAAGSKGLPVHDLDKDTREALIQRGAVARNGGRGKAAHLVAKEFASNGASAEASGS